MAVLSPSTALLTKTLHPKITTNHRAPIFINKSTAKHESNKIIRNCSPQLSNTKVSAISGSPGIEAGSGLVSEDTTNILDTVEVLDLNGNAIPISDLWKDRKAVVAFARHFGCVLCRKRADYLAAKKVIKVY
uniref:Uncharacterized protein n=1 Tax=Salix viminalis TaxID=40686 RepID=A0A6N2LA43_SALVM